MVCLSLTAPAAPAAAAAAVQVALPAAAVRELAQLRRRRLAHLLHDLHDVRRDLGVVVQEGDRRALRARAARAYNQLPTKMRQTSWEGTNNHEKHYEIDHFFASIFIGYRCLRDPYWMKEFILYLKAFK